MRRPRRFCRTALAASIFHYGEFTVGQAKALLARDGHGVRAKVNKAAGVAAPQRQARHLAA